jgi:hypothetical protein
MRVLVSIACWNASDIIGATLEAARQQTADLRRINDSSVPRRGLVSASRTHIQL